MTSPGRGDGRWWGWWRRPSALRLATIATHRDPVAYARITKRASAPSGPSLPYPAAAVTGSCAGTSRTIGSSHVRTACCW